MGCIHGHSSVDHYQHQAYSQSSSLHRWHLLMGICQQLPMVWTIRLPFPRQASLSSASIGQTLEAGFWFMTHHCWPQCGHRCDDCHHACTVMERSCQGCMCICKCWAVLLALWILEAGWMDELVSQCLPFATTKYVFALQKNGWKGECSPANIGEQGPMQGASLVHQSYWYLW